MPSPPSKSGSLHSHVSETPPLAGWSAFAEHTVKLRCRTRKHPAQGAANSGKSARVIHTAREICRRLVGSRVTATRGPIRGQYVFGTRLTSHGIELVTNRSKFAGDSPPSRAVSTPEYYSSAGFSVTNESLRRITVVARVRPDDTFHRCLMAYIRVTIVWWASVTFGAAVIKWRCVVGFRTESDSPGVIWRDSRKARSCFVGNES